MQTRSKLRSLAPSPSGPIDQQLMPLGAREQMSRLFWIERMRWNALNREDSRAAATAMQVDTKFRYLDELFKDVREFRERGHKSGGSALANGFGEATLAVINGLLIVMPPESALAPFQKPTLNAVVRAAGFVCNSYVMFKIDQRRGWWRSDENFYRGMADHLEELGRSRFDAAREQLRQVPQLAAAIRTPISETESDERSTAILNVSARIVRSIGMPKPEIKDSPALNDAVLNCYALSGLHEYAREAHGDAGENAAFLAFLRLQIRFEIHNVDRLVKEHSKPVELAPSTDQQFAERVTPNLA